MAIWSAVIMTWIFAIVACLIAIRATTLAAGAQKRCDKLKSDVSCNAGSVDVKHLRTLLARYRDETPLGHQPHMIAYEVDKALGRDL